MTRDDSSPSLADGPATLAIDGQLVEGSVLSSDAELGYFLFVLGEALDGDALPSSGSDVRIRWQGSDGFDAKAQVVEIEDPDRWVLSVPVGLDPSRTRQATRMMGEGAWSFTVDDDGPTVEVYDLSERGLGLCYPRGEGPSGRGAEVAGTLSQDDGQTWDVVLSCTNVRAHPVEEGLWIVGGRLRHDADDARERLKRLVAGHL
jgi:hypothetical protein